MQYIIYMQKKLNKVYNPNKILFIYHQCQGPHRFGDGPFFIPLQYSNV